jgi:hypothetical protein
MVKLRHSGRLPQNAGQIIACDRIVLPATNNTTSFSYQAGNNIARFEIPPSVGMVSPFKMPRLCFRFKIIGEEETVSTYNPFIGLEGLIQQIKVSSLRTGAVLADTRFYPRQVGSCVYNSQGTWEIEHNHMPHEMKSPIHFTMTTAFTVAAELVETGINVSLPLTTNLLESPGLLSTHLYGLGQGLQIEVMFASDESFFNRVTGSGSPTYEITELRLHYDLLRFDPGSVSTSGMKQVLFESVDSRSDVIQSNDETRNVPIMGSAVQSLVIDAVQSQAVNNYNFDSNEQASFGLNTLRIMIAGQSLPIQQELTYAQQNQVTRTGIAPIQRENFKAVTHDAELNHPRSLHSQTLYEDLCFSANTNANVPPAPNAPIGEYGVVLPSTKRFSFGCLFGKEGVPMRYGNLSYRLQATQQYGQNEVGVPTATVADFPVIPTTSSPYTLYSHITSLKMLQVDEGSGLVSVQS